MTHQDIKQADFVAIAKDAETGTIKGQCLLVKGDNDKADKLVNYPQDAKKSDAIIITSLSGKRAIPDMLAEISTFSVNSGLSELFAKTRASNDLAHTLFTRNGFTARGPETMGNDDYQSYLYKKELTQSESPVKLLEAGAAHAAPI